MESHKIWIANLQDALMNHICQGFLKTYAEIVRLCGGHKLKISIQTVMEGIPHLSSHKIMSDYKVFLESVPQEKLNHLIRNCYLSYAKSALESTGITKTVSPHKLTGPIGSNFIHEVYINVARYIWMRPDVLIDRNTMILKQFVKDGIEQAVRNGVDLKILSTDSESTQPVTSVKPPSIKEQLNIINGRKTILDESSDEDEDDEDTKSVSILGRANNILSLPSEPICNAEMTIDNDDLAPDNRTINFSVDEEDDDTLRNFVEGIVINEKEGKSKLMDNTTAATSTSTATDNCLTIEYSTGKRSMGRDINLKIDDADDDTDMDTIGGDDDDDDDDDDEDEDDDEDDETISDIDMVNTETDKDDYDDKKSTYSVTFLSHSDMLSSRLDKLGVQRKLK